MAAGIDQSRHVLVFVTEIYRVKVNGNDMKDNCKKEFNHAETTKPGCMLAVVMEPAMRDASSWKGRLGMTLGGRLYADFCDVDEWSDADLDEKVKTMLIPKLRLHETAGAQMSAFFLQL
jgi:hypothetical protein